MKRDAFTTDNVDHPDRGSWLCGTVTATYEELKEIFGVPKNGPSGDEKVQCSWEILFWDGNTYASIYDWKEDKPVFQVTDWHIGGNSHKATELVEAELAHYRSANVCASDDS